MSGRRRRRRAARPERAVPRDPTALGRRVAAVLAVASLAATGGLLARSGSLLAQEARAEAPAAEPDERAELLATWARSYYPGRSGDILLVPENGEIITSPRVPFMHGSPWDYDARVPLILYGPGHVRPGTHEAEATHQDVGATLEALLGLPRRPTRTGRVLSEALVGADADGPVGPPRTIVLLVLDGFRPDYLERYADRTPTLRRLAEQGAWFPRARASVLPTATAVAHTTLVTATDPAVHGITGNSLYDRARAEAFNAFEGSTARNVMALTLADRWSAWTRGRAVIAVQGGTFYPAAALAGHGACIFGGRPLVVAYFDSRTGGWRSNPECYALPGYLLDQNIQTLLAGTGEEGEAAEASGARTVAAALPRFEGEATVEILEMEAFGEDDVSDLLLVNHKATDYVGHAHGPGSERMRETVGEVDGQVARVLSALEEKAGSGGFVLVVTADHGMPEEPGEEGRHVYAQVDSALSARFDPEGAALVVHYDGADNQIYLDASRMEELGVEATDVARFLEGLPLFRAAFTEEEVRRASAEAVAGKAPEPAATP